MNLKYTSLFKKKKMNTFGAACTLIYICIVINSAFVEKTLKIDNCV